jgi:hypothetical protein
MELIPRSLTNMYHLWTTTMAVPSRVLALVPIKKCVKMEPESTTSISRSFTTTMESLTMPMIGSKLRFPEEELIWTKAMQIGKESLLKPVPVSSSRISIKGASLNLG